jgi:hypothetical protein
VLRLSSHFNGFLHNSSNATIRTKPQFAILFNLFLHLLHTEFPFADEFACSAQARDGGNTKAEAIGGGRCSRHGLQVTAEMMQGCRGSSVAAAADGDVGGCDDAW